MRTRASFCHFYEILQLVSSNLRTPWIPSAGSIPFGHVSLSLSLSLSLFCVSSPCSSATPLVTVVSRASKKDLRWRGGAACGGLDGLRGSSGAAGAEGGCERHHRGVVRSAECRRWLWHVVHWCLFPCANGLLTSAEPEDEEYHESSLICILGWES